MTAGAGAAAYRWLTRDDLGAAGAAATGLLHVPPDASGVFPLSAPARSAYRSRYGNRSMQITRSAPSRNALAT
ncbi:hypothetical protein ABZS51_40505, partial [Nonomuraea sp. NPDC005501]